jgi:hypothetical protein
MKVSITTTTTTLYTVINLIKLIILLIYIGTDGISVVKLGLRTLACMTSCQALSVEGILPLFQGLFALIEEAYTTANNSEKIILFHKGTNQHKGAIACYLLTSTLPWCFDVVMKNDQGKLFLLQIQNILQLIYTTYNTPFDINNSHSIFHENIIDDLLIPEGPPNHVVWDNIQSSLKMLLDLYTTYMRVETDKIDINEKVKFNSVNSLILFLYYAL